MTIDNKLDKDDDQGEQTGGQGGVAGEVRFRYKEAMSIAPRDDALPPTEIKRLLSVHKDIHKERVEKQKLTRKERKALKEGRIQQTAGMRSGSSRSAGRSSPYKQHPITQKAQFSGMDNQVTALPSENNAKTNEDKRNELENRLENRNELRYQNAPKFNPKPRPF